MIDPDRLVATLVDLISIPSVNPGDERIGLDTGEHAVVEYVAARLRSAGSSVTVSDVGEGRRNVFGRLGGGSGGALMLAGHTDTVGVDGYPDGLHPWVEDGKVFGRGACDMKGALAAFLEVAEVIFEQDLELPGDVVIAGLADEEHRMLGSIRAGRDGPWGDAVVVGEPTSLQVAPCHRGEIGMTIVVYGKAAHSSRPELGVNAISHMAEIVRRLDRYPELLASAAPHPLAGRGSYSAGVITGGTIVSIVPDRCELDIDRRILPGESAETVRAELATLLADLDSSIEYDIVGPTWDNRPLDTDPGEPIVGALIAAHMRTTGDSPSVVAVPYCTDGPNLNRPAVIYGPGSIDVAHSAKEYVPIDELFTAAQVYLDMALTFGLV